mmetsp:Transcript_36417/g.48051  ORF Transcript_36417/g.48051 Transcript_36417/m.48051 type:complete len:205 (-) Transcript_36417:383-997(-)
MRISLLLVLFLGGFLALVNGFTSVGPFTTKIEPNFQLHAQQKDRPKVDVERISADLSEESTTPGKGKRVLQKIALGALPFIGALGPSAPAAAWFQSADPGHRTQKSSLESKITPAIYGSTIAIGVAKSIRSSKREKKNVKQSLEQKKALEKQFLNVEGEADTDEELMNSLKDRMKQMRQIKLEQQSEKEKEDAKKSDGETDLLA